MRIVATFGPASNNPETIHLFNREVAILRLNGSWVDLETIENVKSWFNIPILLDIPGNRKKIRKNRSSKFTDDELIDLAIKHRLDFIGLSYVETAEDVQKVIEKVDGKIKLIVKIETEKALRNLPSIIETSDIFLVDRGDLGSYIGYENVPEAQKTITRVCKSFNKEVIIATEMLMSTLKSDFPSCADVSDVYNALAAGADYVMLSEETAIGNPNQTINIMKRIINRYELRSKVLVVGDFNCISVDDVSFLNNAFRYGQALIVGVKPNNFKNEENKPLRKEKILDLVNSLEIVHESYLLKDPEVLNDIKYIDFDIFVYNEKYTIPNGVLDYIQRLGKKIIKID